MKLIATLLMAVACWGQSISITSPTASQAVKGNLKFSATLTSVPSTATVEYVISDQKKTWTATQFPWDVWIPLGLIADGTKTATAIARNHFGTTLATSSAVTFLLRNDNSELTFTGAGGTLSGDVTVTVTSKIGANHSTTISCNIDGRYMTSETTTGLPWTNFDATANTYTFPGHRIVTGNRIVLNSGTPPTGLALGITYFAIVVNSTTIKFATSYANSQAGTAIDFSNDGVGPFSIAFNRYVEWKPGDGSPASGVLSLLFRSTRLTNGTHNLFCSEWPPNSSAQNGTAVFAASGVDTSADTMTLTNHLLSTGRSATFTTSGTLPSPLALATIYYAIYVDENTAKWATSLANARAGTAIDLTSQGSGNHTATFVHSNEMWQFPGDGVLSEKGVDITISNSVGPMELRSAYQEIWTSVGDSTTSLAPFWENNDGTTTAITASAVSYLSQDTAVATVSASGVVTPVAVGTTSIIMAYSSGSSPVNWFWAETKVNVRGQPTQFKHFSQGSLRTAYDPSTSHFVVHWFSLNSTDVLTIPGNAERLRRASVNSHEAPLSSHPGPDWSNYSTFLANWNSLQTGSTTGYQPAAATMGPRAGAGYSAESISNHPQWLNFINESAIVGSSTRKDAVLTMLNGIKTWGKSYFMDMMDEATNIHGNSPNPNGSPTSSSTPFASLVVTGCASTPCFGTATVTIGDGSVASPPATPSENALFCVYGSATSAMNACYNVRTRSGSQFTFRTINVVNGSYNSSTDPGLQITGHGFGHKFQVSIGSGGWTQIVKSGSTATVTQTGHTFTTGDYVGFVSATSQTNINDTYPVTVTGPNTFTIPIPSDRDFPDGTYNSGTDAGLKMYPYLHPIYTNAYLDSYVTGTLNLVSGRVPIAWPPAANNGCGALIPWTSDTTSTDYNSLYVTDLGAWGGFSNHQYSQGQSLESVWRTRVRVLWYNRYCYKWENPVLMQTAVHGGGYYKLSAGNYMNEFADGWNALPFRPEVSQAQQWMSISMGVSGWKIYAFCGLGCAAVNQAIAIGYNATLDPQNHMRPGKLAPAQSPHWNAFALSSSLVKTLEPYILQPMKSCMSLGRTIVTGCKESSLGRLLISTSFEEVVHSEVVSFTGLTYSGTIIRYRLNPKYIDVADVTGDTSETISYNPGETVIWLFLPTTKSKYLRTQQVITNPAAYTGGVKTVLRYGYHDLDLQTDGQILDCGSGVCNVTFDPNIGLGLWVQHFYLDSSNVELARSDKYLLTQ